MLMRADYDSEADALLLELGRFQYFDHQEQVDDDYCNVGIAGGRPVAIELLNTARHLDLLEVAAKRYGLDGEALIAAAQAALAAPDRVVVMEVHAPVAA
jgi:hypothetical protein